MQSGPSEPDPEDEEEAKRLDEELRQEHLSLQEAATDTNPAAAQQLGKILFMGKTVTHDGQKYEYTATREESVTALLSLLRVRNAFLDKECIPHKDGDGNPTVLSEDQRTKLLTSWKESYHSSPRQIEMQIRDSWKASGSAQTAARKRKRKGSGASQAAGAKGTRGGKGKEFGPNKNAVKTGKHSRWSRHLQREYGA